MKVLVLTIATCFIFGILQAQTIAEIDFKIDSLQKVKQEILNEKKILDKKEERTDNLIKIWQEKKTKLAGGTASSGTSGIKAKVISSGGTLRDKPMGSEISKIPAGSTVYVQNEFSNLYFKVIYNGQSGYLSYSSMEQNAEIDKMMQKADTKTNTTTSSASSDPKYKRLKDVYGHETAMKILDGEIWKGMSPGMLMESLGKPVKTTETKTDAGMKQVWTYSNKEVTILNGAVTTWTNK